MARLIEIEQLRAEQKELQLVGMPFGIYAENWLEKQTVSDGQYRSLLSVIYNHLMPAFKDDFLHQVDETAISQYIHHKLAGNVPVNGGKKALAPRTVNRHKAVLQSIFQSAIKDGFLAHNEAKDVKGAKVNEPPPRALEREELQALFKHLPNEWHIHFKFLLAVGCRFNEMAALTWGDIDGTTRKVHIRRNLKRVGRTGSKVESGKPKTNNGYRAVKVSTAFHDLLMEHKASQEGKANPRELVFPNRAGGYLDNGNVRVRVWQPAVRAAKLTEPPRIHDLRHTFASRHIYNGTNIKLISYWLGHRDTRTTLDIYGHILKEAAEQEADLLDDLGISGFSGAAAEPGAETSGLPELGKAEADTILDATDTPPSEVAALADDEGDVTAHKGIA